MHDHGLSQNQLDMIRDVLAPYAPKIDKVGLFGSRATGTYRENSDIDMVIYGDLGQAEIDRIGTLFDASALAVPVDVQGYHLIAYPPLKDHIDAVMRTLFSRRDF